MGRTLNSRPIFEDLNEANVKLDKLKAMLDMIDDDYVELCGNTQTHLTDMEIARKIFDDRMNNLKNVNFGNIPSKKAPPPPIHRHKSPHDDLRDMYDGELNNYHKQNNTYYSQEDAKKLFKIVLDLRKELSEVEDKYHLEKLETEKLTKFSNKLLNEINFHKKKFKKKEKKEKITENVLISINNMKDGIIKWFYS